MPILRLVCAVTVLLILTCVGCTGPRVVAEVDAGTPLPVYLNGRGPYRFGIDTGQSVAALVTPRVAKDLSLPVVQHIEASDGTSSKPVDVVRIDAIELASCERRDQLGIILAPGDPDRDGSLGMPMFAGLLIEHDGPTDRLRILRGSLPEPDGRTVLATTTDRGLPVLDFTIGDQEYQGLVDSGSEGGLLIPLKLSRQLPLYGPPVVTGRMQTLFGEFDLSTARLRGVVKVGEHRIVDPELTFSDHFEQINIGRAFLRQFRVTIDAKNERIKLETPGSSPQASRRSTSG